MSLILNSLICYLAAAVIPVIALFFAIKLIKKKGKKISALHTVIGAVSFVVMLVLMFVLMLYAFSADSTEYMSVIMDEAVYKISVAVLFFTAVSLVRYFALNAVYFNRYKEENGISFMVGYGACAGVAVSVYCVFMLIHIAITALSTSFTELSSESVMLFENGARISAFTPFYMHIFIAIIFVMYFALMLISALFMEQHSARPYKWHKTLRLYLLIFFCELLTVLTLLFASSSVSPVIICVIALIAVVLATFSVKYLYKYKEEQPYEKQFD